MQAQNAVRKNGPDPNISLIHDDEIHEIQRIWREEHGDWRNSAYEIYENITKQNISPLMDDLGSFGQLEQNELNNACNQHDIPYRLVSRSLQVEFDMQGMTNRQKVHTLLEKLLAEEWDDDMTHAIQKAQHKRKQLKDVYE